MTSYLRCSPTPSRPLPIAAEPCSSYLTNNTTIPIKSQSTSTDIAYSNYVWRYRHSLWPFRFITVSARSWLRFPRPAARLRMDGASITLLNVIEDVLFPLRTLGWERSSPSESGVVVIALQFLYSQSSIQFLYVSRVIARSGNGANAAPTREESACLRSQSYNGSRSQRIRRFALGGMPSETLSAPPTMRYCDENGGTSDA